MLECKVGMVEEKGVVASAPKRKILKILRDRDKNQDKETHSNIILGDGAILVCVYKQ